MNKTQKLQLDKLYRERKFYEMSQEIIDMLDSLKTISKTTNHILDKIYILSEKLGQLTRKRTSTRKKDIVNSVINDLQNGIIYTTPSLASEYSISSREARYIIDCVCVILPSVIKTKRGRVIEIKLNMIG
jgi:hypothetical protein